MKCSEPALFRHVSICRPSKNLALDWAVPLWVSRLLSQVQDTESLQTSFQVLQVCTCPQPLQLATAALLTVKAYVKLYSYKHTRQLVSLLQGILIRSLDSIFPSFPVFPCEIHMHILNRPSTGGVLHPHVLLHNAVITPVMTSTSAHGVTSLHCVFLLTPPEIRSNRWHQNKLHSFLLFSRHRSRYFPGSSWNQTYKIPQNSAGFKDTCFWNMAGTTEVSHQPVVRRFKQKLPPISPVIFISCLTISYLQ